MKLLFSVSNEIKESVISDSDFKQHYPSVNINMNWLNIKPYIRKSTTDFVLPFLGKEFYEVLITHSEGDTPSEILDPIIESLKDAIAYMTIYKSLPYLNMIIADMGAQQVSSENGTSQATNQWRYNSTRWEAIIDAYKSMDRALSLMEASIGEDDLTTWAESAEYTRAGTPWFKDTAELDEFIEINKSRRAFIALRPYLVKAERELKRTLSAEFYAEIVALIGEGDLSDQQKELIGLCKHYIAESGLNLALPHLRFKIDGNGLMVISQSDGFNTKDPASDKMVTDLIMRTELDRSHYHDDIVSFLYRNVSDFPTFKEFGYVESNTGKIVASDNGIGGIMF